MSKRKREPESQDQNQVELGSGAGLRSSSHRGSAIQGSNIGYQLLIKCGWKEGTGLGVAEQGRLDPIETHVKHDKRGIGAEKKPKKTVNSTPKDNAQVCSIIISGTIVKKQGIGAEEKPKKRVKSTPKDNAQEQTKRSMKKVRPLFKGLRKLEAEEKHLQEKAFKPDLARDDELSGIVLWT